MTRNPWKSSISLLIAIAIISGTSLPVVMAQTTPGQSPGTTTSPKKKPTPVRTPPKRTNSPPAKATSNAAADERTYWESIKDSKNPADFQAYLRKYGEKGKFSDLAHNRLTEIDAANKPADPKSEPIGGKIGSIISTLQPPNKAGAPWRSPQGIDFVYVPAGSFDMGSDNGESIEKPVHRVTISQGFYFGEDRSDPGAVESGDGR